VKGRVLAEHRRLDVLFVEARDAFRDEEVSDSAAEAFHELREALETHFDQEDRLYYPAIWALRPDLESGLREFVAEHEKFRNHLEQIEAMLARSDFAGGGRAIEALAGDFGRHEVNEENMLRSLDRDLEDAG
jgi:hypothetical protein